MAGSNSGQEDSTGDDGLSAIPVDDPIRERAGKVVEPPVDAQLELLPTNLMDWEDFERLLLDLGRAELGLRALSFFGKRGQAQKGLDVVGTNAFGTAEGIQSKRYQEFTVADLNAAVEKFTKSTVPFRLVRLVIGVGAKVDERTVVERKTSLNAEHHPLEIDIWDQSRISEMLRDKPDIVIKYFGPRAAERFCVPYVLAPIEIPAPSAVATADAVLLGPLTSTDAQRLVDRAKEIEADEPGGALTLYREVQSRLTVAGFPGHAAEFDGVVVALSIRTGQAEAAIRPLMDALWASEAKGDSRGVDRVVGKLRDLADLPAFGPTSKEVPRTPKLGAAFAIADFVSGHVHTPVPARIELPAEAIALTDRADRARAIVFAAECALGNDDLAWVREHREQIEAVATEVDVSHVDLAVRLRLAIADATGEWASLVHSARTRMRRDLKALTLARFGRHNLLEAAPVDADNEWRDAIGEACLTQRHADAADWLYSQRFVASRFRGILEDTWHPLAQALSDLPSQPRIVTNAEDARERAFAALHYDEPRAAAINLRRQLLDGVRSASFHDEREARRLLGELYRTTNNLPLAAYYTIGAGDPKEARAVAAALGDDYYDITESITSPLSWVASSALQFATEQADLIPDEDLGAVVELALCAISDVMTGARLESPILSPQIYLSAYGLLAALAERLSADHARKLLDMLADAVVVEEHHARRTDESHVEIAAGIARTHDGELRDTALEQLVGLYARGVYPFPASARDALLNNLDQVRDRLQEIVDKGHREASALLGYSDPDQVSSDAAQAAAQRLSQPTTNGPNGFGTGTGAINDSLLAFVLPVDQRILCIDVLLQNAASPWEPSSNRDSYLIAVSNLSDNLDEEHRVEFFNAAMGFATSPPPSQADAFNASMGNPLGSMRVNDRGDSRPAAILLAARLAKSVEEKRLVRDAALRLIGVGSDDDYRVTTALQLVQSELGDSIGLLAQGSWTLRSLAAILWAESADLPGDLGLALSQDRDPRVRRALATALADAEHRRGTNAWDILLRDPRWSVRSILTTTA
ncbi:Uncharacterised protein [Mycobacteroides abscessus subsp. bolletii]|uniref:hypothetical protein n=1 Tax=Mycobacteroides abscessus TaxID=36809 RepID=UPI0009A8F982|nr:hypothetical protein [Mycobacteroides abscessus]SLI08449.1 Uncharacterised protein [Mycobacteroides abscessus subsp. bolletii]